MIAGSDLHALSTGHARCDMATSSEGTICFLFHTDFAIPVLAFFAQNFQLLYVRSALLTKSGTITLETGRVGVVGFEDSSQLGVVRVLKLGDLGSMSLFGRGKLLSEEGNIVQSG